MKTTRLIPRLPLCIVHCALCIVIAASAVMTASGAAVWEQGSWGSWGEDFNGTDIYLCDSEHGNLVRGVHGYWTEGATPVLSSSSLTDGYAKPNTDSGIPQVGNNKSLTFTFGNWKTIREVRVYSSWKDSGREQISINSVTVVSGPDDSPVTISPNPISGNNPDSKFSNYAYLKDSEGGNLAEAVSAITINFGRQQNNGVGYAEIEIIGADDTASPCLYITGAPDEGCAATPSFGTHHMDGPLTLSAPAIYTNAAEDTIWSCTGWRVWTRDAPDDLWRADAAASNPSGGHSFLFQPPEGVLQCKVEWQWEVQYLVDVSATSGGAVSTLAGPFFPAGTELSATATPDAQDGFIVWSGDLPHGASPTSRSLAFTVDSPVHLVANFTGLIWVDDDAASGGDGSAAAPFQTVDAGVAAASAGAIVVVRPGTYQLASSLTLSSAIKVLGETGDFRDVLVSAPASKRRVFTLSNPSAFVGGMTLKGTGGEQIGVAYVQSGTLENCRVTNGKSPRGGANILGGGAGVANDGGTVRYCTIDGCTAGGNIYAGLGLRQTAGTTEYCVITNNAYSANHGSAGHPCSAGAFVSGGVLRGTLIARNSIGAMTEGYTASTGINAMGLYLRDSPTVDGCAVVENSTSLVVLQRDVAGVYCDPNGAATIVNTVIVSNFDAGGVDLAIAGKPGSVENSLTPSRFTGLGNKGEATGTYYWTDDGEFELEPLSHAVDGAAPMTGVRYVNDLYGRRRVSGFAMDMGPSERQSQGGEAAVTIQVASTVVVFPATTTFLSASTGFPSGLPSYSWRINGVEVSTDSSFTKAWEAPGTYLVELSMTVGETTASATLMLSVLSRHIYLDASCPTPTYPYATPGTAANKFEDVRTLMLEDGSLTIYPGTYTATATIVPPSRYEIRGVGNRDDIVLQRGSVSRLMEITSPATRLHGITLKGGGSAQGATLYLVGGAVVEDLNLFGGVPVRNGGGGGCLYIANATIRDSTIGNVTTVNDINYGLGVRIDAGGLVERCVITNVVAQNLHYAAMHAQGVAVHIAGGTLRNCLVAGNKITGVFGGASTLGNERKYAAGIYQSGGVVENCTVADNTSVAGPAGYFRAGGTMTNCIVTANSNSEDDGAPSSDANIAGTAEAAMTSCFTGDPLFNLGRKRGQPWYGLRDASPCVNAGVPLGWMDANATDLAGNRRRIGLPDIGCYESQLPRPTCLMVH